MAFKYTKKAFFALILSLSICANVVSPVHATADELLQQAEERKSLPIDTNQIENWPKGPEIGAEGAILMDAETGIILYAKNIYEKLYPASTTKILTCLIASENARLDEIVKFSHDAVFSVPYDGSNMGMDAGQSITMEECLYGILVGSANEAANAVAEHIGGSMSEFAELMNKRATELGCQNSHFVNANGLYDDEHYTTPYDLAMIGRAFFSNELLCKISNTPSYHFEPSANQPDDFYLRTKNQLVNKELAYEGIVGGKTGFTAEARQTLVTCAQRNGMKLICVIMKEESPAQFTDTIALFDYGFNNFSKVNVSENETRYTIDNANFFHTDNDIFGNSKPILGLNTSSNIILPNVATFKDLDSTISYDTESNDEVAIIEYTYHGAYVGNATIDIASNNHSNYEFDTNIAASKEEISSKSDDNTIFINVKVILFFIIAVAILLILIVTIHSILKNTHFSTRERTTRPKKTSRRRGRRRRRKSKPMKFENYRL